MNARKRGIGDDPEPGNDDGLQEGSNGNDNYVLQRDFDDVRHNNAELESDRPKKIWNSGYHCRREKEKSDSSATIKAREDNGSGVEDGIGLQLSNIQLGLFDGTGL